LFHVHVDHTIDIDPPLAHILSELVTGIHAHSLFRLNVARSMDARSGPRQPFFAAGF
jgi:hypothetical protein